MTQSLIPLSQSHLRLLSLCPRKYQYNFLDQFFIPSTPSQTYLQEELGKKFHLVMQQHWMDLDIEEILAASPQINQRFQSFKQYPPLLIAEHHSKDTQHLTEHRRRLKFQEYLLVGIFDLLVLTPNQGQIVDWKSYRKPKNSQLLRESWQTKLYPFLLAETSHLSPEQISMTYWFALTQEPEESQTITFQYSEDQHQKTQKTLKDNLHQLSSWLKAYQDSQIDLPQVDETVGICTPEENPCPYRYRCQRAQPSSSQENWDTLLNLSDIPPIPLEPQGNS